MKLLDALSQAQRDHVRRLYDDNATFDDIALALGASRTTARKLAATLGWPKRPAPPPFSRRRRPGGDEPADEAADQPSDQPSVQPSVQLCDPRRLASRVEHTVKTQLAAAEQRLARSSIANAERNARILASLVKSLAELQRLNRENPEPARQGAAGDDDARAADAQTDEAGSAIDMDRLRDELAATLDRMRANEPPRSGA